MATELKASAVVKLQEGKPMARFWWNLGGEVISPGALSAICGVSRATIYDWARAGKVRAWTTKRGEFYVHIRDCIEHAAREGHHVQRDWRRWAKRDE